MSERPTGEQWIGQEVKLWVGLTMMGYPETGVVSRWIPDYPEGPSLQVDFEDFAVPFACLKPEWVFPITETTHE